MKDTAGSKDVSQQDASRRHVLCLNSLCAINTAVMYTIQTLRITNVVWIWAYSEGSIQCFWEQERLLTPSQVSLHISKTTGGHKLLSPQSKRSQLSADFSNNEHSHQAGFNVIGNRSVQCTSYSELI